MIVSLQTQFVRASKQAQTFSVSAANVHIISHSHALHNIFFSAKYVGADPNCGRFPFRPGRGRRFNCWSVLCRALMQKNSGTVVEKRQSTQCCVVGARGKRDHHVLMRFYDIPEFSTMHFTHFNYETKTLQQNLKIMLKRAKWAHTLVCRWTCTPKERVGTRASALPFIKV